MADADDLAIALVNEPRLDLRLVALVEVRVFVEFPVATAIAVASAKSSPALALA